MANTQTTTFDRFNDALRSIDDQVQDWREQFETRRKDFEKDLRKRADRVRDNLEKSDTYRRADRVRKDVGQQVDKARGDLYDVFGIASKSEVEKLNKKLATISRKLNELAKEPKAGSKEALEV